MKLQVLPLFYYRPILRGNDANGQLTTASTQLGQYQRRRSWIVKYSSLAKLRNKVL